MLNLYPGGIGFLVGGSRLCAATLASELSDSWKMILLGVQAAKAIQPVHSVTGVEAVIAVSDPPPRRCAQKYTPPD
jgi:hypothetical protein